MEEYMNPRNLLIGCAAAILALGIAIGFPTFYALRDIQTNRDIAKACIAAGGTWEQNAKGDFECRKR
jgi:hypothetical protein